MTDKCRIVAVHDDEFPLATTKI